jgi:anti-anti-sigma regulatory factor
MTPIDLDTVDAIQVIRTLAQHPEQKRPQFLVDCSSLKCLRSQGVSYVISQLLMLHQSGSGVWLCNMSPVLKRCLELLRLDALFQSVK